MPSKYKIKNSLLSRKKLDRLLKTTYDNAIQDRKLARETYDYFKDRIENGHPEEIDVDKAQLTHALKAIQTATTNLTKLLDLASSITAEDSPFENLAPTFKELQNESRPKLPSLGSSSKKDNND